MTIAGFKRIITNQTLAHITVLITAATSAYLIASQTTFINPTIATLIAVISVKQTLHETLQETSYQMVGTIIGAAAAIALSEYLGFQWWTIPILITLSFLLSIVFKLGVRGGTIISITIIFITAPFIDESITSQQRIFGVALGIILAALVSLIPLKQHPHLILQHKIDESKKVLQELLYIIGQTLTIGQMDKQKITQWIVETDTERMKVREYNQTYTHLEKTRKWSPALTKTTLNTLNNELQTLTQQVLAAKNITKILEKISSLESPPKTAVMKIGKIIQQSHTVDTTTGEINTTADEDPIGRDTLGNMGDTQTIILTSNLYSEADKLKELRKRK